MDGALECKRQIVLEHAIVFALILGSGKLAQIGKGRHGTKCEIKQVLFNAKHGNPYARFLTDIKVACRPDTSCRREDTAGTRLSQTPKHNSAPAKDHLSGDAAINCLEYEGLVKM